MLSLGLSEEQSAVQRSVREFAAAHLRPKLRAIERQGVTPELLSRFAELGLVGVDWPEAAGGQGLGATLRCVIEEELAFGDVGAALALDRAGAAGQLLLALGTPQAHQLLRSLADGRRTAALAAAEEGKAQDDFRTVAASQDGAWLLNGKKAWVFNGADADLHLVLAQVERGQGFSGAGIFAVAGADKGLRAGKAQTMLGLNAVPVREVVFEGLKLPGAARLDVAGSLSSVLRRFYDRLGLLTASRAVGLSAAAFEYARSYAEERTAFGKPIGHFQAMAFLLSDMAIAVDAARLWVWKAAWAFDQGQSASREIAAAQGQALEAAFFCANSAVQVLGGAGYLQDHPAEKWMRDAKTLALYGQHAQAASAVVAAGILDRSLESSDLFPLPSLHASLS